MASPAIVTGTAKGARGNPHESRSIAPAPAMAIALFCGSIVAWVSGWTGRDGELTNVVCRRSRSRPPCYGDVLARLAPDDRIEWRCQACGEEGVISGWQGTKWDRSA